MNKTYILAVVFLLAPAVMLAQKQGKIEMYRYMATGSPGSFQPSVHLQSPKKWYFEARYNYEDAETISAYAGRNFSGGNSLTYSLTPILGYAVGKFNGISMGINTDLEMGDGYFSAQSQYSISNKTKEEDFFFSWSELGYSISERFFTGATLQYTRTACATSIDPGILVGISFGNLELPVYLFKPTGGEPYVVVGLSYEFKLGKKK